MLARLAVGAAFATVLLAAAFASTGGATGSAQCSRDEALRVGKPYFWDATHTVRQVLCGSFAGEGSDAMAVSFVAPTCWPVQGWAVFRHVEGDWQVVHERRGVFIFKLTAVGGGLRETAPKFRNGDPRCIPSGGMRARIWHWNGTAFTPSAWKRVGAPRGPRVLHVPYFESPTRNIYCSVGDEDRVYCRTWTPPQSASMGIRGNVRTCKGSRRCTGPCGPRTRRIECSKAKVPKLAYGERDEVGPYRCKSAFTGVTCTVVSGAGKGKGFRIAREGIKRIGG
jgi:hypothetical protein